MSREARVVRELRPVHGRAEPAEHTIRVGRDHDPLAVTGFERVRRGDALEARAAGGADDPEPVVLGHRALEEREAGLDQGDIHHLAPAGSISRSLPPGYGGPGLDPLASKPGQQSQRVRLAARQVESVEDQLEVIVATGVPGAVAVALRSDGRVGAAAGFADLRTGEALTVDHRFRIGSVTKIFVAALVLQLVAEGLLDLDGDAAPFAEGITIRQLLNHTSGLTDFIDDYVAFFEPYRRNPAHRWELSPREQLPLVMEKPRLFAPGEGWSYHGSNYLVLRLIVEEKTGVTLREALRQRILAPLGLERTDLVEGPLRGDCARGYLPADNPVLPGGTEPVDVTEIDVPFHGAGGGVVSTAGDIAALLRAQLRGELLPDALRTEMLRAVESDWVETDRYGLGIGEITAVMGRERSPCGAAWGHIGFSAGYTAIALSSENGERQVVICANGSPSTPATSEAFWDATGRLAWQLYCG
jgi:D-alanyl-D-alanine carboxypeptidase